MDLWGFVRHCGVQTGQSILRDRKISAAKNFEVYWSESGEGKLSWRKLIHVELSTSKFFSLISSFIEGLLCARHSAGR